MFSTCLYFVLTHNVWYRSGDVKCWTPAGSPRVLVKIEDCFPQAVAQEFAANGVGFTDEVMFLLRRSNTRIIVFICSTIYCCPTCHCRYGCRSCSS